MNDVKQQSELIKQYLLGDLTEERRQHVEERLMSDRNYRDEVLMGESELVEDYLTEALLPVERRKFENHYLSTPRQLKKLKLTKALLKAAQSTRPPVVQKRNLLQVIAGFFRSSSPRLRFATVSMILLVVLGAGVLFYAWRLRLEKAELRKELAQLNTPQNIPSTDSSVPSLTLLPLSLRDQGALPRVTVTPATNVVQLRVPVASNSNQNYRVELRTLEGDQVVEFETKTQAPGAPLILQLPTRILKQNDYVLTVTGLSAQGLTENLGEYGFRVLQQ